MTMIGNRKGDEDVHQDLSVEVQRAIGRLTALTDELNGLADQLLAELEESDDEPPSN